MTGIKDMTSEFQMWLAGCGPDLKFPWQAPVTQAEQALIIPLLQTSQKGAEGSGKEDGLLGYSEASEYQGPFCECMASESLITAFLLGQQQKRRPAGWV